jgi:transcriptional regulator with XRE-family HTH domain
VAARRTERGVRVSELARLVGVSPSLISQIERGQSRPSVNTLFALAEALEAPVDTFFRAQPEHSGRASDRPRPKDPRPREREGDGAPPAGRYAVGRDERATIDIEGGVRWERLTPKTLDNVDFLELIYAPYAESNESLYRHPGTEMVLMLSGRIDIVVGFERYELSAGDSIHFPSSMPHRYVNPTDEEARAVTVIVRDDVSSFAESTPSSSADSTPNRRP